MKIFLQVSGHWANNACSELLHMEDILKLFRLTRLSLEGSMISDASCFMDCRIGMVV